ncbi:PEGA domain-containing protein [Deltaproteobacteria bacterium TL4]
MKAYMTYFIFILCLGGTLMITTVGFAQEEKPQAAVVPVSALGDISEVEKQIFFNTLLSKLSQHYNLVSQAQFLEAQEVAFEELDAQECTEEQCIRKIQDLLQVENLFALQILRFREDTQLTLTLVDLDKKLVESDLCNACSTIDMNKRIMGLVSQLISKNATPPPSAQSGGLHITSTPTGAQIILDEQPLQDITEALFKNIPAGQHTLTLKKGNLEATQQVQVEVNALTKVDSAASIAPSSHWNPQAHKLGSGNQDSHRWTSRPTE